MCASGIAAALVLCLIAKIASILIRSFSALRVKKIKIAWYYIEISWDKCKCDIWVTEILEKRLCNLAFGRQGRTSPWFHDEKFGLLWTCTRVLTSNPPRMSIFGWHDSIYSPPLHLCVIETTLRTKHTTPLSVPQPPTAQKKAQLWHAKEASAKIFEFH